MDEVVVVNLDRNEIRLASSSSKGVSSSRPAAGLLPALPDRQRAKLLAALALYAPLQPPPAPLEPLAAAAGGDGGGRWPFATGEGSEGGPGAGLEGIFIGLKL